MGEVGVMRCMACGGEMILTAVASDGATMPAGFRQETLQCLACRDIERRFVFGRGPTKIPELPRASASPQPVVSPSVPETIASSPSQSSLPVQGISSLTPAAIACAPTWARAVEKLRSCQADIHVRAVEEKSDDWNARFNQALEKLAPPRRQPPATGGATACGPEHLVWKSARTLRAELRAPSSVRDRPAQSAIEPPREAILRFNRFWDSLLTAGHRPDPMGGASSALAQPLPPSLSLVPVETPEEA
jgi:hypothetical protein